MKIAVFLDVYTSDLDTKDTGQLVVGFSELGHQCEIIGISGAVPKKGESRFIVRYITQAEAVSSAFWSASGYDLVLCYTWLRKQYLPVMAAIRQAGVKLVTKSDSDGRYNYPVTPRWGQDIVPRLSLPYLRILLRKLKRRAFVGSYLSALVRHIELADGVILESPGAYSNVSAILVYAGRPDLVSKLFSIQNPVDHSALSGKLPTKRKLVTAVGFWTRIVGEGFQKNTDCVMKVVPEFLRLAPDYEVALIGDLGERAALFDKLAPALRERLILCGDTKRGKMLESLGNAQIFFMPSMVEGFSIAASEAVCMGCSIVGTPLECLVYLSRGGAGGTISYDFKPDAVLGALLADVSRWRRGNYDAQEISGYWRPRLSPKTISQAILNAI